MSPTIVVDGGGRVVAVVGASGGTKITTAVAQVHQKKSQGSVIWLEARPKIRLIISFNLGKPQKKKLFLRLPLTELFIKYARELIKTINIRKQQKATVNVRVYYICKKQNVTVRLTEIIKLLDYNESFTFLKNDPLL